LEIEWEEELDFLLSMWETVWVILLALLSARWMALALDSRLCKLENSMVMLWEHLSESLLDQG
jgi:hypothetical protein